MIIEKQIEEKAKKLTKKLIDWEFEQAMKYAYREGIIDELKSQIGQKEHLYTRIHKHG